MTFWIVGAAGLLAGSVASTSIVRSMAKERRLREFRTRRHRLLQKYGAIPAVENILAGELMCGMTQEMTRDVLGTPDRRDTDSEQTIWTYLPTPTAPEHMYVFFKEGRVSGWDYNSTPR